MRRARRHGGRGQGCRQLAQVLFLALVGAPASGGGRPFAAGGEDFDLHVVVSGAASEPDSASRLTPLVRDALARIGARVVAVAPPEWRELSVAETHCILLSRRHPQEARDPATEADIDSLERLVAGGSRLIVVGAAAGALPGSAAFSRLVGRVHPPTPAAVTGVAPAEVAVAVLDQRHPVTQCVTHLRLSECFITALGDSENEILAAAVRTAEATDDAALARHLRPAVWTKHHGRGEVAVLALETVEKAVPERRSAPPGRRADGAREPREDEVLSTLLARFLEWMKTRRVRVRLAAELPLAATHLGPDDAGLVPGVRPLEGFYRGRQIASFMTYHGADWLTRPEREKTERPEAVLDSLDVKAGSTVVDLGAGVGYFSERLARRVGPSGKVLAVDIQKEMLEMLVERMKAADVHNVVPVLATPEDPRLAPGSVDLVLMVDVYHELSEAGPVIAHVRQALKRRSAAQSPGRLVLVEYRGEDPGVPIKPLHRMTEQQARAELEAVGFRWVETKRFLPEQHVLIFERAEKAVRPAASKG